MRATSILNDFLSKATAGTSVSECAELSDSETGETANGSEEGGVFPRKNQKVSAEAADSKDTTFPDEAANIPQDGFTGHTGNEDAFEGSSSDLHTGELPPVKQENWNTQDANSIDGSNRPTAFERSQRNDGPYVYQKGLLSFVEAGADARACASLKNDGFYTGGAPQLHTPMGAKFCKSCRSNMPQFLTACPCCGDGTTVAKSFGMTNDAAHTESALSAPHAESSYRPAGINLED